VVTAGWPVATNPPRPTLRLTSNRTANRAVLWIEQFLGIGMAELLLIVYGSFEWLSL
jgi:hypothetical protein